MQTLVKESRNELFDRMYWGLLNIFHIILSFCRNVLQEPSKRLKQSIDEGRREEGSMFSDL